MASELDTQQNADAIIGACTYHRSEFDSVLIKTPESKLQAQAASLQTAFEASASSGLGVLDRFPDELTLLILRELDLVSYLRFRRVNNRARVLATSSREYKAIAKHGLEGLKPLLKAQLGHLFTVTDFYKALSSPNCKFCGKFAPFLFLLSCTRCCFTCLQISSATRVLSVPVSTTFAKAVKLPKKHLEEEFGPKLRVVYGKYTLETWPKVKTPRYLVLEKNAKETLVSLGLSQAAAKRAVQLQPEHQEHNDIRHLYCYRYMSATAFPWLDPSRDKVERGVSCKGCQFRVEEYVGNNFPMMEPPWGFNDRDRIYSADEFLYHFRSCAHAKKVWDDSQGGTVVQESDFTREGGIIAIQHRYELD
ncbi:hypothetical protein NM208_g3477 [Fusarium decemcellulare]|uniref:Uncharacterized protein n=1 Tax=Fusarium decemcellulare TaxID=57161 RepID=A0ACC1SP63_9HYPO|nr:hypothetical protein NM208_g3477 [Fusarium decemcellulare]